MINQKEQLCFKNNKTDIIKDNLWKKITINITVDKITATIVTITWIKLREQMTIMKQSYCH